ncbi:putative ferric reductase transmembrane component [Phaeomoniella chlamydospora]|uniref:Putative ferric reductase transmembrane component n=1 Tax=Phaeomoniella chlamydospora TaxID=158046 RepID=A0A0G2HKE7_PHACM|nr:putative ferric reductase transmembrane component [Phaeomoniella chlamydospora]
MRITITPVTVKATAKIAQDGETVLLSAKIPVRLTQIPLLGLRVNIRDGWEPAQHVFITVPSLSRTAKFQAHPYTILSMPDIQCPTDGGPVYRSLELIIRARDGFTRDLLNMIKEHQKDSLDSAILANLPVRIDGPYGSTEVLEAVKTADRALFIAGGSGLAVTSPLADATSRNHCSLSQTLNQLTITIPKDRLSHYWILRSTTHTSWLPSNLSNPTLLPPTGTDSLQGPARKEAHSSLLDEALSWMEKYGDIDDGKRIVVVVSGPDGMIRGVRKKCAALVKRGWKLEIWVEKFGW